MAFLTRTDLTRNINRFYVVDMTPTLFGEWAVLREWGQTRLTRYPAPRNLAAPPASMDHSHSSGLRCCRRNLAGGRPNRN
jgi:hypothetical protein